jgi:uncharacterized protein
MTVLEPIARLLFQGGDEHDRRDAIRQATEDDLTMTAVSARLPAIDALRGIALFGILVVNLAAFHSGVSMAIGGGVADSATNAVILWLFTGKFILIFSFLFGWGVHTQAAREAFRARYLRRLLGLFLIGVVHGAFFFFGDILATYAILGLFMLRPVLRDWPVRKLVRSAVILLGVQALILLAALMLGVNEDASLGEYAKHSAQLYMTGGFWEVVPQRLADFAITLASCLFYGWGLVAMFRLGLAAAKTFAEGGIAAARPLAQRIALLALPAGLVANAVCAVLSVAVPGKWALIAALVQQALFMPVLALGYLAAAALILTSRAADRIVAVLSPAGRMSLSVYVGQSVIMSLLFHGYGLGLARSIGSSAGVLVCVAVYAALLGFSHLWLGAFRIGPLDWLLRSITEWRWLGLRRAREVAAASAPSLAGAHNL